MILLTNSLRLRLNSRTTEAGAISQQESSSHRRESMVMVSTVRRGLAEAAIHLSYQI